MMLSLNIDFSVQPMSMHRKRYGFVEGKPRDKLRLDTFEELSDTYLHEV